LSENIIRNNSIVHASMVTRLYYFAIRYLK